jgi:hypothetical protein
VPHDISEAPLEFTNDEQLGPQTTVHGCLIFLIIVGCSLSSLAIVFGGHPDLKVWQTVALALLPWAIAGTGFWIVRFRYSPDGGAIRPTEKSTLRIDADGVHVSIGGRVRDYAWTDIRKASVVSVPVTPGARLTISAVQIVRRGQILVERYSDLIDESFGVSPDELRWLIQQGVEKWGGDPPN